jgi:aryl-phospho-beta-D-glucosidase BglC (GH1 family)
VLLEINSDRYIGTKCTADKRAIIDEIVDYIVSKHGRFLKQVNGNGGSRSEHWVIISTASARLKTAQAIQYRMRKKATQSKKNSSLDMTMTSADALETQRSKAAWSSSSSSTSGGSGQTRESSDKCTRCDRLEAHIRWILSTLQQYPWSTMETKGACPGIVTPPMTVKALLHDSLTSLDPLELSMADSLGKVAVESTIDPEWLLSSLSLHVDDKTDEWLDSTSSFSSLSISS